MKLPAPERIQGSFGDALYIPWMPPKLRWLPCVVLVIANLVTIWYFELWPILEGAVLIIFAVVNVIALLIMFRYMLGRTIIERSRDEVLVKRGPLLWPRTLRVVCNQLDAVGYSARYREQDADGDEPRGHMRKVYKVFLATKDGDRIWVVKHLSSWRSAIRVRDAIQSYLKIEPTKE